MLYTVLSVLSQIYCDGPILRTVQDSYMFPDSKHFVDMSLKFDPIATLRNFDELGEKANDIAVLREFVNSHFNPPGTELVEWFPRDWVDFPSTFLSIHDYHHRRWALHLHRIWRDLCRRVRDDVRRHQDHYSLLYVPHPFIIPGGRFREFYYWDSFWILKGLIFSEMYETARGIIKNLAYMVDNHGFVPNGGRVYYLTRSQPPLLIPMVYDYFLGTGDLEFVMEVLPTLEKEYLFWINKRSRMFLGEDGKEKFPYYQYRATLHMPRPESYREDYELVHHLKNNEDRVRMWSEIASAAETGWDFSTRWFAQEGEGKHNMKSIRTWSIVPVDLNAFMCVNARILASLFEIRGDFKKVAFYQQRYEWAKREMKEIHWNETDGIWYDYDLERKTHSNTYYVSNAVPLYAKCYDDEDDIVPRRVLEYLKAAGVMNFTKGLPTSLAMGSEQQWDKENAWPPMIHMVIEGFRTTGEPDLMEVAEKMATSWLTVTYQSFIRTHAMFEKYNVTTLTEEASAGGGGEYEVQTGFGWTNGVILDLLDKYGDKMKSSSNFVSVMSTTVKLLEIEDTTSDSQYGMGLRNTAHAFVEALKVFDDAKRADRKDWKLKAEHKGDKCFNKHFPIGKVYYLKKTYNIDMETLFQHHWNEIEKTPQWNCNVHSVDRLGTISEHADILHYTTSEVVVIKGRDFVVCRMWRKVGDSYVVAATSFDNDVPVVAKKKRGWVNVCAGKFTPSPSDPTKCIVEYIVSVDLKDKLTPKAVLSSGIADMVIKDARNADKYIEEEMSKQKS